MPYKIKVLKSMIFNFIFRLFNCFLIGIWFEKQNKFTLLYFHSVKIL